MRESAGVDSHLRVFARLARKLMHDEFRSGLERENDPVVLCARLREVLES
jgi:mannitol/fructose-specific phosphotransferase system IIA component (Ntr-type)